jgi:DNA replication and repair protein RecF
VFLKNITFRNFRNYESLQLQFSAGVNLIAGGNAQGKTNILEGIYFLSTAKSHRTNRDDELIQRGKLWFYLKGQVSSGGGVMYNAPTTVVEIINTCGEKKRVRINGKSQERISSIIGKVNVVMFSPEDLSLVKGAPSERRRFLDILISRISPSYLYALQEYYSALRQRNELLRGIRDKGEHKVRSYDSLDSWNVLLVKAGSEVIRQRISIISELAELAKEKHRQLTSDREDLCIEYQSQLDEPDEPMGLRVHSLMDSEIDIDKAYEGKLKDVIELDKKRGSTSVGPHRDDLVFTIDGVNARKFCSQGQQRTGVLSLKLANLELTGNRLDEYPIILLDDVTSELDDNRVSFLFDLLSKIPVQTFLTATSFDGFPKLSRLSPYFSDCELFVVENGRVGSVKRDGTGKH